jgi:hypothetical protein
MANCDVSWRVERRSGMHCTQINFTEFVFSCCSMCPWALRLTSWPLHCSHFISGNDMNKVVCTVDSRGDSNSTNCQKWRKYNSTQNPSISQNPRYSGRNVSTLLKWNVFFFFIATRSRASHSVSGRQKVAVPFRRECAVCVCVEHV